MQRLLYASRIIGIMLLLIGCGVEGPTQADLEHVLDQKFGWTADEKADWELKLVGTQACPLTAAYRSAGITERWIMLFMMEQRGVVIPSDDDLPGKLPVARTGNNGAWILDPIQEPCRSTEAER